MLQYPIKFNRINVHHILLCLVELLGNHFTEYVPTGEYQIERFFLCLPAYQGEIFNCITDLFFFSEPDQQAYDKNDDNILDRDMVKPTLREYVDVADGHIRTEKIYVCQLCGSASTYRQFRQKHRSVHTGKRPFTCVYCGKQYVRKDGLRNHEMMQHSHESGQKIRHKPKNHKCSLCPKAFMYQSELERHRLVHTGKRNHHCSVCGKRFSLKSDLRRHQRNIHKGDRM